MLAASAINVNTSADDFEEPKFRIAVPRPLINSRGSVCDSDRTRQEVRTSK